GPPRCVILMSIRNETWQWMIGDTREYYTSRCKNNSICIICMHTLNIYLPPSSPPSLACFPLNHHLLLRGRSLFLDGLERESILGREAKFLSVLKEIPYFFLL
ncbi:hypothetical protein ALC62_06004, partial [Cyphomyrmex costatus]